MDGRFNQSELDEFQSEYNTFRGQVEQDQSLIDLRHKEDPDSLRELTISDLESLAIEELSNSNRPAVSQEYVQGSVLEIMSDDNILALVESSRFRINIVQYIMLSAVLHVDPNGALIADSLKSLQTSIDSPLFVEIGGVIDLNTISQDLSIALIPYLKLQNGSSTQYSIDKAMDSLMGIRLDLGKVQVDANSLKRAVIELPKEDVVQILKALRQAIQKNALWANTDRLRKSSFDISELDQILRKILIFTGRSFTSVNSESASNLGWEIHKLSNQRESYLYNERFCELIKGYKPTAIFDLVDLWQYFNLNDLDLQIDKLDDYSKELLLKVFSELKDSTENQAVLLKNLYAWLTSGVELFGNRNRAYVLELITLFEQNGYINQVAYNDFYAKNYPEFAIFIQESLDLGIGDQSIAVKNFEAFIRQILKKDNKYKELVVKEIHLRYVTICQCLEDLLAKYPNGGEEFNDELIHFITNLQGYANLTHSNVLLNRFSERLDRLYLESANYNKTTPNLFGLVSFFVEGILNPKVYPTISLLEANRLRELALKVLLRIVYAMPNKGLLNNRRRSRVKFIVDSLNFNKAQVKALTSANSVKQKRLESATGRLSSETRFSIGDDGELYTSSDFEVEFEKPKRDSGEV